MADNILDSITEQYHSLTKSGKKLADYVFSHTAETQYLSITSLAENCDVSEATITRFCRGLGLSGYNAFKLALAQADRTTDLGDSGNSAEPVSSEDSIATIAAKVHAANIISLNESYELFDVYEGAQIQEGYKSLAYKIVFRAKDRTLTDEEVTNAMNKIITTLEEMGASLRK